MNEIAKGKKSHGWQINLEGAESGPEWCRGIKIQSQLINFTDFKQFGTGAYASAEYSVDEVETVVLML